MLDVAPTELLLVAVIALIVIGPKDLPRAMRFVGQWIAKARTVARHFRSGMDEMIRQSELEDMEKKWAAENERIMREHTAEFEKTGVEMIPLGGPPESEPPGEEPAADEAPEPVSAQPVTPQPISPKPKSRKPLAKPTES